MIAYTLYSTDARIRREAEALVFHGYDISIIVPKEAKSPRKYALDGVKGDIIWIAGGIDKGNDYGQIEKLVRKKVKAMICMGKDNEPLIDFFGDKLDRIAEVDSMKGAVSQAFTWAKEGDVVLLSPACASFDLFANYEDRGDKFKQAVNKLTKTLKAKEA